MRGEAEMGKSVPVLKEFRAEAILAPLTPEKPMANGKKTVCQNGQDYIMAETEDYLSRFTFGNRGEIPLVSKEVGSSSHCDAGFAWEANQSEQWAPLYTPPSRFSESTSRNSMMKETDPLAHWRGMTFSDLLALNHGLAIPMAGNQTSHGLFSNLDWQFSSTALMSENQESMGLRGSNIRDPDLIRVFNQTAEIQQKSALPNASKPVFAPETPDHCKRLQDNAVSWKTSLIAYKDPNKQNGEDNQVSVIDDSLGIQETHLATEIAIESYDPANGDNPSPDVNKTIEQKPRRRKHRPKVVKEAKANAKQTPKQRKPKPTDANETPKPKRKYVRKNKTNIPSTTPPECGAEALDGKIADPAVKSCRKALNFDLESQVVEKKSTDAKGTPKQKRKYVRKSMTNKPPTTPAAVKSCRKGLNFDLEDEVQDNHLSHRLTDTPPSEHFPQGPYPAKEKDFITTATREDSAYDVFRNDQTIESCMSMSEREAHTVPHPTEATPTKHEFNAATSLQKGCFTDAMHPRQFFACSPNYSTCGNSNEGQQIRGLKRANSCSAYVPNKGTESLAVHRTPSQENYMFLGNAIFSCTHGMYFPEIRKKRKPETVLKPKASQILSSADALEHISKTTSLQNPSEPAKSSKYYYSVLAPHCNIGAEANSQASAVLSHQANTQLTNWGDIDKLKRSKAPTCVHDLHSQEGSEVCKKASRSPANGRVKGTRKKILKTLESHPKLHNAKQERRKSGKKNFVAKSVTSSFNMVYKHNPNLYEQHFTGNSNGPFLALPWTNTNITNVDDIIEGMKQLSINREGSSVQYQEQNTLIPYQVQNQQRNAIVIYQRDGVMIPFEGTQSSKKSLRAKVDIDDETNRVWNLLLENINSQGIDGTDEEKKKWWEEERKVFRGRVDSFIARMRLVQGDRRFSPWKGSVVDSVVGVFLTQNVSDHLSSSAYMSLAARYPLKSAKKVRRDSEEEFSPSAKEQEICIVEIDDDSDNLALSEKTVEGLICDSNSRTFHDTDVSEEKVVNSEEAQLYRARSIKESETPCTSADERVTDDVTSSQHSVISSQNSVESPRKMVENGLSYDNSSEVEDPTNSSNPGSSHCSGSFVELLKMAEKPMLHATYSPIGQVPSSLSYSLDQEKVVKYGDPSHKAFRTKMDCFSNVLNKCSTAYHPVEEYHLHSVDEENKSVNSTRLVEDLTTEAHNVTTESATEFPKHKKASKSNMGPTSPAENVCSFYVLEGEEMIIQSTRQPVKEQQVKINHLIEGPILPQMNMKLPTVSTDNVATESTCASNSTLNNNLTPTQPLTLGNKLTPTQPLANHNYTSGEALNVLKQDAAKQKTPKKAPYDWDSLRKQAQANGRTRERTANTMDSLDWEAIRRADVNEIAYTIRERGMNNRLAERIKEFLDRLVNDHGSIDLEWLRDVPPDKAKEYLLSIKGLGLKSVECVRLLTLHHLAFPVDTNVGRIAVRLGWVPLQPLPESLQLHLLELYPILESIQKYLWPRLCKLDQRTLYELHYHMITFGKVFCTKRQPNCNACPLRGECRHFASAFASARLALPGPQDTSIIISDQSNLTHQNPQVAINSLPMPLLMGDQTLATKSEVRNCEPIVEIPASPEQEPEQMQTLECDIEDALSEDPNEIPTIKLNMEEFTQTLQAYMQSNSELQQGHMSKALVALAAEAASIPTRKLKNVSRLRTEHHVYELPDTHHLLRGLDKREPDDPCPYLLAIWSPGETANSTELPEKRCNFQEPGQLCSDETCFYCNSQREADSQIVRGTLLIPCRTAMRGSFPLNGTYFQVNEVFADQDSSLNPIQVPRALLWNLPRRTVYFGTSVPTIFKGLSTEGIQQCFWRGYVCVRGFDQKTRAPRPLMARLHFPASKSKARGKSSEQYS